MKSQQEIEYRMEAFASYIVENQTTLRKTAEHFNVSKSTVYLDLTKRLPQHSNLMYQEVRKVLETNKRERAHRGGKAVWEKYYWNLQCKDL